MSQIFWIFVFFSGFSCGPDYDLSFSEVVLEKVSKDSQESERSESNLISQLNLEIFTEKECSFMEKPSAFEVRFLDFQKKSSACCLGVKEDRFFWDIESILKFQNGDFDHLKLIAAEQVVSLDTISFKESLNFLNLSKKLICNFYFSFNENFGDFFIKNIDLSYSKLEINNSVKVFLEKIPVIYHLGLKKWSFSLHDILNRECAKWGEIVYGQTHWLKIVIFLETFVKKSIFINFKIL